MKTGPPPGGPTLPVTEPGDQKLLFLHLHQLPSARLTQVPEGTMNPLISQLPLTTFSPRCFYFHNDSCNLKMMR